MKKNDDRYDLFLNIFWGFISLVFLFVIVSAVLIVNLSQVDVVVDCGGSVDFGVVGDLAFGHQTVDVSGNHPQSIITNKLLYPDDRNDSPSMVWNTTRLGFNYPFSDVMTSDTVDRLINVPEFENFILNNIDGNLSGNCKFDVKGSALGLYLLNNLLNDRRWG